MNNKNLSKILIVIVTAIIAVSALTFFIKTSEAPEHTEAIDVVVNNEQSVTLSIEGLYEDTQVPITSDTTALSLLEKLNEEDPGLQLEIETYEGLGSLVTAIAGQKNGDDNHYWQYTVNGEMPMVGAGDYTLTDGETVAWEFKASEF